MPSEFSDAALAEAESAIKSSQANTISAGEKRLNKLGAFLSCPQSLRMLIWSFICSVDDGILSIANSQLVSATKSDASTEAYSLLKDQVSTFVQTSKVAMKVLDEVAKAHPFIQSRSSHSISSEACVALICCSLCSQSRSRSSKPALRWNSPAARMTAKSLPSTSPCAI